MRSETATLPLAPLVALTEREERFAQHLAVFDDPAAAWIASGEVRPTTGRRSIQSQAYRMRSLPHVRARILDLRNQLAANGPQATRAALVAELDAALAVDIAEIVRLTVVHCPTCYSSPAYATAWPLLAAQAMDAGSADVPPLPLPAGEFDPDREPWDRCPQCLGAGRQVVRATPTNQLSPAARRLVRGYELDSAGNVKKILLVDQAQLRQELHRATPGFYAPAASVALNLHADIKPLRKGVTVEEAMRMLETIAPAPVEAEFTEVESQP